MLKTSKNLDQNTKFSKESADDLAKEFNLQKLQQIIQEKIASKDHESYSYKLFSADFAKIAQKIGEEGVEVALAAVINGQKQSQESRQNLIGEVSDLLYHLMVLIAKSDIALLEIFLELEKRNNHKK